MGSPGGSRGGSPGGVPGGQKRALLGGDPCFAIFANFCNRFGGLIFSRFRVDPPRDPAPPGGGTPRGGGVRGGPGPPKIDIFGKSSWAGTKKWSFFGPSRRGGVPVIFEPPGSPKLASRAQTLRSAFYQVSVFLFNVFLFRVSLILSFQLGYLLFQGKVMIFLFFVKIYEFSYFYVFYVNFRFFHIFTIFQ